MTKRVEISLGERIAWARRTHGWTQEDLAERIGRTRECIAYWEIDKKRPNAKIIPVLSAVLKIPADVLAQPVRKKAEALSA